MQFFLACLTQLLLGISIWTCFSKNIFEQAFFGISFFHLYGILSAIILGGFFLFLLRQHKIIVFGFCLVFFSWILTWTNWKNTFPPKTYIPLNDNFSTYRIEKDTYRYTLCHTPKVGERLCGIIGSSVYPLDIYVNQEILFTAQWRSDWGKPMCHVEGCPSVGRSAVIDILDIKLATASSILE